jgi:hypothetical protein
MHLLWPGALTLRTSGWELVSRPLRAFGEPVGPMSRQLVRAMISS